MPRAKAVTASLLVSGCLAVARSAAAQEAFYERTPNHLATVRGTETIRGFTLDPAKHTLRSQRAGLNVTWSLSELHAQAPLDLLGVWQSGSEVELYFDWLERAGDDERHHLTICRAGAHGEMRPIGAFVLTGGPGSGIRFFQPPGSRDGIALINIMGTLDWDAVYLVSPDRQSATKLFTVFDYEFTDLSRSGGYQLIGWNRERMDLRCGFNLSGAHFYPEVFVPDNGGFRKIWPPGNWAHPDPVLELNFRNGKPMGRPAGTSFQIMAGFADLERDGRGELVVLEDKLQASAAQSLSIYALRGTAFQLITRAPLPPSLVGFYMPDIIHVNNNQEILVEMATPAKCGDGGYGEGSGITQKRFAFAADGRLREVAGHFKTGRP